jgi:hypothetical protein
VDRDRFPVGRVGDSPLALKLVRNEEGQAFTEYILLIAIIVGFYLSITAGMARIGLAQKLMAPITGAFAATYRYGSPTAKGYGDPGGPINHPRIEQGSNNFRIFYNPDTGQ